MYTVFAVVAEITRFSVRGNTSTYFHVYLVTEPVYALLSFLSICDVFYQVFKSFYQIWWFKFILPGTGIVMLGVAILIATLRPPIQAIPLLSAVFVFEIIVRFLQFGVFFLIFGLAQFYDLFWRQYSF